MRSAFLALFTLTVGVALGLPAFAADSHTIESLIRALDSPIPEKAMAEARDFDDKLMATGDFESTKAYLVTDTRSGKLNALVDRLLRSMGQEPGKWVVRLLDTDPKTVNAFATGGKYVYVFTGLLENAQSDDELAFVLSHELGHNLLKHNLRKQDDASQQLAAVIGIIGAVSGGETRARLTSFSQLMLSAYSRVDEQEADAVGVTLARHAGFDALRGADFFSRDVRVEEQGQAAADQELAQAYQAAMAAKTDCEQLTQQWNVDPSVRSRQNEIVVNQTCADFERQRLAYNQMLADNQSQQASHQMQDLYRSHPPSRERTAGVTALVDYLAERRDLESLKAFQPARSVLTALQAVKSPILCPALPPEATDAPALPEKRPANTDIDSRLRQLKSLLDQGLITTDEYNTKKKALLDAL